MPRAPQSNRNGPLIEYQMFRCKSLNSFTTVPRTITTFLIASPVSICAAAPRLRNRGVISGSIPGSRTAGRSVTAVEDPDADLWSPEQVAIKLGCHRSTVDRMIEDGS